MPVTFEQIRRDPGGFWRAQVTDTENGFVLDVDRRHGSWIADVVADGTSFRREVEPWIAAELQRRVMKMEKAGE